LRLSRLTVAAWVEAVIGGSTILSGAIAVLLSAIRSSLAGIRKADRGGRSFPLSILETQTVHQRATFADLSYVRGALRAAFGASGFASVHVGY